MRQGLSLLPNFTDVARLAASILQGSSRAVSWQLDCKLMWVPALKPRPSRLCGQLFPYGVTSQPRCLAMSTYQACTGYSLCTASHACFCLEMRPAELRSISLFLLCVCLREGAHVCHGAHAEARGQPVGVSSLLPSHGVWDENQIQVISLESILIHRAISLVLGLNNLPIANKALSDSDGMTSARGLFKYVLPHSDQF